jgi:hypothetical protein
MKIPLHRFEHVPIRQFLAELAYGAFLLRPVEQQRRNGRRVLLDSTNYAWACRIKPA